MANRTNRTAPCGALGNIFSVRTQGTEMYRSNDFDLRISLSDDAVRVLLESPIGQAQEIVPNFPAKQLLGEFSQLGRLRQGEREALRDFGSRLFQALFPGSVYEFYVRTLEELTFNGKKMRLNLWCDAHLAQLPWELAFDSRRRFFLSLDPNISIIRVWPSPQVLRDNAYEEPVRILAVFPSPIDLPPLDLGVEIDLLKKALEIPIQRKRIELSVMDGVVTLDRVVKDLTFQEYHILHFSGHGTLNQANQTCGLFFATEEGKSSFVDSETLRVVFTGRGLRMVSIIAGDSASLGAGEFNRGLALSLLEAGVSVVIGLQGQVTDRSALRFVRALYSTIADGLSIGSAMREARQAIWTVDPDSIDWAMPVIYTTSKIPDLVLLPASKSNQEAQSTVRVGQSVTNVGGEVITGDSNYIRVTQQVHNVNVGGKIVGVKIKEIGQEEPEGSKNKTEPNSESDQMSDEQIQGYISDLKSAILRVPTLSTSERINTMALTEKLRFMILEPSQDAEEISRTLKSLSAAGSEVTEVVSEFRKRLHL